MGKTKTMKLGDLVVEKARGWIGTPYQHQASCRGAGADCLGLIRGIWREIYGAEPEKLPNYSIDWSEPQGEERLWRAALRHLVAKPLNTAQSGEVLLFRMRDGSVAKHLGIAARIRENPTFIHAYSGHRVLESPLSQPWQRRIVARFSFPEEG